MTIHSGPLYSHGDVSIGPVDVETIQRATKAPDVCESVIHWLTEALVREDIYYFSIIVDDMPVGQIFLHDMSQASGESLVGYHLFEPRLRGYGVGTKALGLLQRFVTSEMTLQKLVIITSRDNNASQKVAQKCGFTYAGVPRENPVDGIVFQWNVPQNDYYEWRPSL